VFWLEPALLAGIPDAERIPKAAVAVRSRYGKKHEVVRVEPIFNSEQEIKAYMVYTRR
jgi:hypothetical protein